MDVSATGKIEDHQVAVNAKIWYSASARQHHFLPERMNGFQHLEALDRVWRRVAGVRVAPFATLWCRPVYCSGPRYSVERLRVIFGSAPCACIAAAESARSNVVCVSDRRNHLFQFLHP